MQFYDSVRDPIDNSVAYYYHWRSTSSTGGSTTIFDDIYIPASPNFPPPSTGSQTRYLSFLPGQVNYDGVVAGTHPLVVANVNTTTILTRVLPSGTLTANTYKVFQQTADTPSRIEFHVGVGSNQAGDKIAYDGYFFNSILSSTYFQNIDVNSTTNSTSYNTGGIVMLGGLGVAGNITVAGNISSSGIIDATGGKKIEYFDGTTLGTIVTRTYVSDIGIWNMDTTEDKVVNIGSTSCTAIIHFGVSIIDDSGQETLHPNNLQITFSTGFLNINRLALGLYDNSNFDSTTVNRGYVYYDKEI